MKVSGSLRDLLRSNRAVLLGASAALVVVTAAYYLLLRGRELDSAVINDRILLFFLRNVNAVLVLTIAYVLIRNLVKLWVEQRRRQVGSKFTTKLVATYIGLSLIPGLLLFAYATELVQGSLDNLFRMPPVEQLLEPGFRVSQALTSEIERRNLRDARRVLDEIAGVALDEPTALPALSRILQRELSDLDLDLLAVYQDTEFVHALLNPRSGLAKLPELGRNYLLEVRREGQASQVDEIPGHQERWILGAVIGGPRNGPQIGDPRPAQPTTGSRTIVVAGTVLEASLAASTERLVNAAQDLQQIKVQEDDIRAIYLLLFLMVTLLILLISSWVGLYLARRITVPIQALVEGTRRITSGELHHRVEEQADDELGVLVDSFNNMTEELERSKLLLERSNLDLTRSNQRLDQERARIGAVLENLAAGVIATDSAGRVVTSNTAALEMLGLDAAVVVGRPLLDDRGEVLQALFGAALESPAATQRQVRVILRGEWRTFEIKSTPMTDEQGSIAGRVVVLEDLTELIRAQELATWNEAARRIAHEIKNPLTPIKLAAERMLRKYQDQDPDLGPALDKAMRIVVREVSRLKSMVDEFARFARMPRPKPTAVDLRALLDEIIALYRNIKPGIEVDARVENELGARAEVDGEQLRHVLVNLLDNAVEATPAPGRIEVLAERSNGSLRIRVADTGPGIPPEAREKLFLPYYSTKGRGSGLGLAIVHRIITDHHGTIRVDDNAPRGTVFTIELPQ